MRPLWKDILAAVWLGMILPGIVLNIFVLKDRTTKAYQVKAEQILQIPESGVAVPVKGKDGINRELNLEAYLTGVLLAEMPAAFHPEALKAQSVAARTYTWKAVTTGGKHSDGSVCMLAECCQAYMSEEDYLSSGGNRDDLDKIRKAVEETKDMVLSYDGTLIEATYFSASGGSTESALAVWGTDYPYLQSVLSPETLEEHVVFLSQGEFKRLMGVDFSGNPWEWFGPITYTEGGGVESMEICGNSYTGLQLRSMLGLRSTAFQITPEKGGILITTQGYGHRVGMSQYGANAMAEAGSTWQKILQHYYPGTTLHPIVET